MHWLHLVALLGPCAVGGADEPPATRTVLADDGFDYDGLTRLDGADGGVGWAGAWSAWPEASVTVEPSGLEREGLETSPGAIRLGVREGSPTLIRRRLRVPVGAAGTSVWMRCLVRPARAAEGSLHLRINGAQPLAAGRTWGGRVGFDDEPTGRLLQFGRTTMFVARYDCRGGTDPAWLWVDPPLDAAEPAPEAAVAARVDRELGAGDLVEIELHWAGGGEYVIDELRVASSWADLVGPAPRFESEYVEIEHRGEARRYPYRLLRPRRVEAAVRYPLVVFLHGAGERGRDNEAQLRFLPERMAADPARERWPCYLVAPQCPEGQRWVDVPWDANRSTPMTETPSPALRAAIMALRRTVANEPVDTARMYLSGLSMGGYGTWELAIRHPDWFAAVAPICGGGDEGQAARLAAVPLWAWHGADDPVVPVERSRAMVGAIRAAGGAPRYDELPDAGHAVWDAAYGGGELLAWMFAQRRDAGAAPEDLAVPGFPIAMDPAARRGREAEYAVDGLMRLAGTDSPLRDGMRLMFLGDSVTWRHRYVGLIERALSASATTGSIDLVILNRGLNGGGVRDLRDGFGSGGLEGGKPGGNRSMAQAPFGALLARDAPDVVVIFGGAEDVRRGTSEAEFARALRDMVAAARGHRARVVLATPWLEGERPGGLNPGDERLDRLAAITREVAADRGATLVDLRRAALAWQANHNAAVDPAGGLAARERGLLSEDGVHPNATGARQIAELIADGIVRALEPAGTSGLEIDHDGPRRSRAYGR